MAPPPQAVEVQRVQLLEPTEAASGSGRLYANALDLSAIGALLGDAVLVRLWPPGCPEQQRTFLCTACSHQQGVSEPAARGGFIVVDPCVQCPPVSSSPASLRELASTCALQGEYTVAGAKVPACVELTLEAKAGSVVPASIGSLLRQRVLAVGSVAFIGDSAFRVAAAVTQAPLESDGSPFRVVRSTKVVISADTFTLPGDAPASAAPRRAPAAEPSTSDAADSMFGGSKEALQSLRELVVWPSLHGDMAAGLGVRFPKGVLLHGPPGTGKTLLVKAIAAEAGAALHMVSPGEIVGAYAGESERRLREAFARAEADAEKGHPTILFLDEVDALAPKRSSARDHESRLVAQLLVLMDGSESKAADGHGLPSGGGASAKPAAAAARRGHVVVVAATNRPDALDAALRRPGRFDREVAVGVPSAKDRAHILSIHARSLRLKAGVDLRKVAEECNSFTGADLAALCREAALSALLEGVSLDSVQGTEEIPEVSEEHFDRARRKVGGSLVRGLAMDLPAVSWADIGGLESVKHQLRRAVEWPLTRPEDMQFLGLRPPRGILLHGAPGCSKTLLARAAVTAAKATLIPLSGAAVYSMYVGEGERIVRDVFMRARRAAPAVVLLDEIDGIAARRADQQGAGGASGGGGPEERLLATLLAELDGLQPLNGVLVIGTTNRPQALDSALLRPGRMDLVVHVPPPDMPGRREIFAVHTGRMALDGAVDLDALASASDGFTGADIAAVCSEAAHLALREDAAADKVAQRHLLAALQSARPSVSREALAKFAEFGRRKKKTGMEAAAALFQAASYAATARFAAGSG